MAADAKTAWAMWDHHVPGDPCFLRHLWGGKAEPQHVGKVLHADFERIQDGKCNLDVLGVGGGAGPIDTQILSLLQSTCPDVTLSVDMVEPSTKLVERFKAQLLRNEQLQKIPFLWHNVTAEEYEKEVKAKEEIKKFDFIYMIEMFHYFEDCVKTIKFLHGLLKRNGKLMIIIEKGDSAWNFLWRTCRSTLHTRPAISHDTADDVFSRIESLGQTLMASIIPVSIDVTHCFTEDNRLGQFLLDFLADQARIQQCFSPKIRASLVELLRNRASQYDMAFLLKHLSYDDGQYVKSFQILRQRSAEHVCMHDFIHNILPGVLSSIGDGASHLNVIGLGSGAGDMDLQMLAELHKKHPGSLVENDVVEPSSQQINDYQAAVAKNPGLGYVKFNWHNMTSSAFQEQWKGNKMSKSADFIHMIHMLYYVRDPIATIRFYQSLLNKNGKLVIILQSGNSGWQKLRRTLSTQQCDSVVSPCVTTGEIKKLLDSMGVSYQSYELHSQFDITECFTEGDEKGELLLNFFSEIQSFRQTAPAKLKADVLETLRHPDCSVEKNGRVIFNNNLGVLVLGALV